MRYFAALLLLCTQVWAHSAPDGWQYPLECCGDQDCGEVPDDRVQMLPSGYRITLYPGDHYFVAVPVWFLISYDDIRVKPSPDGKYHICITRPTPEWPLRIICFFTPPQAA